MSETKRCPYCGEEIMAVARKCKHCGEWLDKKPESPSVASTVKTSTVDDMPTKRKPKEEDELKASEIASLGGMILVSWGFVIGLILLILHVTVPSEERMRECVLDDAVSEVQDQADGLSSLLGDEANLLTNLLTSTDTAKKGMRETILKYNEIEIDEGLFWSTAYLHNDHHIENGELAAFGILGITIPMVLWEDLQMTDN